MRPSPTAPMSERDPGASANLFSFPIRLLMKVWVSSALINPSAFMSNFSQVFSKFAFIYPGTWFPFNLWVASKITPAAFGAVYFIKILIPFFWPLWSLPSIEYLENTLSMISSSSAPLKSFILLFIWTAFTYSDLWNCNNKAQITNIFEIFIFR